LSDPRQLNIMLWLPIKVRCMWEARFPSLSRAA